MKDEQFLTGAIAATDFLKSVSPVDYWESRLPSAVDDTIAEVCDMYAKASPSQRLVFVSDLNQTAYFNLGAFSTRMAMLSVRRNSEALLLRGLVGVVIRLDWPDVDTREGLLDLAVQYHSAAILGDPRRLFHTAVEYATKEATRQLMFGYLQRNPEDKRLEVMGWKAIQGPSGLIYQFGSQPIPEGFL